MAVGIRQWRPGDAPVIVEALNDPGVTDNLRDGLPKPYTEADALKYIIASQEEGAYAFAITEDGAREEMLPKLIGGGSCGRLAAV